MPLVWPPFENSWIRPFEPLHCKILGTPMAETLSVVPELRNSFKSKRSKLLRMRMLQPPCAPLFGFIVLPRMISKCHFIADFA